MLNLNLEAATSLYHGAVAEEQLAQGQRLAVNTVAFIDTSGFTEYIVRITIATNDGDRKGLPDVRRRLTTFEALHTRPSLPCSPRYYRKPSRSNALGCHDGSKIE